MGSGFDEIILETDQIASVDDKRELERPQALMDAYFLRSEAGENLQVWFRLFEGFLAHQRARV